MGYLSTKKSVRQAIQENSSTIIRSEPLADLYFVSELLKNEELGRINKEEQTKLFILRQLLDCNDEKTIEQIHSFAKQQCKKESEKNNDSDY